MEWVMIGGIGMVRMERESGRHEEIHWIGKGVAPAAVVRIREDGRRGAWGVPEWDWFPEGWG